MTRSSRPPAWLARFVALLAAFVLVGQSLVGSVPLCALVGALSSTCCASPCADENEPIAADGEHAEPSLAALEATDGLGGDCTCPFDCALGCCSPNRAVVPRVAMLERPIGESEQLGLSEVEQAPISPDGRGILHVPKRAA